MYYYYYYYYGAYTLCFVNRCHLALNDVIAVLSDEK